VGLIDPRIEVARKSGPLGYFEDNRFSLRLDLDKTSVRPPRGLYQSPQPQPESDLPAVFHVKQL
jgi:hypothetical protein